MADPDLCMVCGNPMIAMTTQSRLDDEDVTVHIACAPTLDRISRIRAGTTFTVDVPDDSEFVTVAMCVPKQGQEPVNVQGPQAVEAMVSFCVALLRGMGFTITAPQFPAKQGN